VWASPTQRKVRVLTIFKNWLAMVENQTDRKLKCLRSDNGGEYKSVEFVQFFRERGIRRVFTAPYNPEENGVAEWMNRTIQERIDSLLHHFGLTDGFWAEALLTAVHIINMSPSRPLGLKILQELWTGRKPDYGKMRIFGCKAYALVPRDERRKLKSRSRKCVFLGYGPNGSFGYRLWDPETHQVVRSSDVVFNESAMHKAADCWIGLRRVTFADVPTPSDGPAQHTRSAS
jgi:transposase InsO family protein